MMTMTVPAVRFGKILVNQVEHRYGTFVANYNATDDDFEQLKKLNYVNYEGNGGIRVNRDGEFEFFTNNSQGFTPVNTQQQLAANKVIATMEFDDGIPANVGLTQEQVRHTFLTALSNVINRKAVMFYQSIAGLMNQARD